MMSGDKKSGFLIFCDKKSSGPGEFSIPGVDLKDKSLQDIVEAVERHIIVDAIHKGKNLDEAADKLKLTRQGLNSKIKKFSIEIK
jgi:transcriptional regulator with PAS, ATPase and Fis domain